MENLILYLSIVFATIYGIWFRSDKGDNLGSVMKITPMILLMIFAGQNHAPWLIILALFFSTLGDLSLSRIGERAFIMGLASFAIAHVMYIFLFIAKFHALNWLVFILILLLAISTFFWLLPFVGKLKFPVMLYIIIISLMAITAFSSSYSWGLKFGVIAFVLSDTLLSIRIFRVQNETNMLNVLVWVFYFGGQVLITIGAMNLLSIFVRA